MLQEDINTSAGLHFMASVRKKAVECQDASTNTDPGKMLFYLNFKSHMFCAIFNISRLFIQNNDLI